MIKILGTTLALSLMASAVNADVIPQEPYIATADFDTQLECVALNIYHESRSESRIAQKAVGFVTMNRVNSERYPSTPCDVVYQSYRDSHGNPIRNKCQFSWYCDGKSDKPRDEVMWEQALELAYRVMIEYGIVDDPTEGATMYHASYVNPYWVDSYDKTVRIDSHIFYK